ncbi:MAG: hypothetical protein SGPRY_008545 [Prymnesium sp.]
MAALLLLPLSWHVSGRGRLAPHVASRAPVVEAGFRSYEELKEAASAYLATLNETTLTDDSLPSPLSYTELQNNGRVDLVEGCMEYGGFVKVSEDLGVARLVVRLTFASSLDPTPVPSLGKAEDDPQTGLVLSAAAKEERLAQQLVDMQSTDDNSDKAAGGSSSRSWQSSSLSPLGKKSASSEARVRASTNTEDAGIPMLQLDGLQRANLAGVALLLSAGFGQSSEQVRAIHG